MEEYYILLKDLIRENIVISIICGTLFIIYILFVVNKGLHKIKHNSKIDISNSESESLLHAENYQGKENVFEETEEQDDIIHSNENLIEASDTTYTNKPLREENNLNTETQIKEPEPTYATNSVILKIKPDTETQKNEATLSPPKTNNTPNHETKKKDQKQEISNINDSTEKIFHTRKAKEELPDADKDEETQLCKLKYVNYEINIPTSLNSYPILRYPEKGCIVRSYRQGGTKRRGFKENDFQQAIRSVLPKSYDVLGDVRINLGEDIRPYEPDIAIVNLNSSNNIRIDVEIDEPYAGISRIATHIKGEDRLRDLLFKKKGWIVIRFSEYQVHTEESKCLKYISTVIASIDSDFKIIQSLSDIHIIGNQAMWDLVQAQEWEKRNYREEYLNHIFVETTTGIENTERALNEQEKLEEEQVVPISFGSSEYVEITGFNKYYINIARDRRIVFYPEDHVYTVDGIPYPSVTTIIDKFFLEFDRPLAIRKMKSGSRWTPNHEHWGKTDQEIEQAWIDKGKKAALEGTILHEQIEDYLLTKNEPEKVTKEFKLFKKFISDHLNLKPYRSEWRIFDESIGFAGTIDLIAQTDNSFDIYDWKRSKKIIDIQHNEPIRHDRWGKYGIGFLNHIDDTSFNRYCLQQNLYRHILECRYKLKISNMFLIVLYPDYENYYKVRVPRMTEEVNNILKAIKY